MRLKVRGERNFVDAGKEGKREGSQVGKKRPNFKMGPVKFKTRQNAIKGCHLDCVGGLVRASA